MKKDYEIIGKLSELKVEDIVDFKAREIKINTTIVKGLAISGLTIMALGAFESIGVPTAEASTLLANGGKINTAQTFEEPAQLSSILEFIDWLIYMIRFIVSSIIGLIATYAGYKWSTDISGSGVTEAKKILKNCAIGIFWVQFGATIANFFVDKIQSMI